MKPFSRAVASLPVLPSHGDEAQPVRQLLFWAGLCRHLSWQSMRQKRIADLPSFCRAMAGQRNFGALAGDAIVPMPSALSLARQTEAQTNCPQFASFQQATFLSGRAIAARFSFADSATMTIHPTRETTATQFSRKSLLRSGQDRLATLRRGVLVSGCCFGGLTPVVSRRCVSWLC